MRGFDISDVTNCGFHTFADSRQRKNYGQGLLIALSPWIVALTVWLVTK